jgi:polyisoprenoid-binding protein YceI
MTGGKVLIVAMAGVFLVSGVLLGSDAGTPIVSSATIQYVSSTEGGQATVSGTSTLHAWTVTSVLIKGDAAFSGKWKPDADPSIALQSIDLVIPVNSLKSTEGGGMDSTMYDALKLTQFPTITYTLAKVKLKTSPSRQGLPYQFDTMGQLTVAGSSRQVNLQLGVMPHDDGALTMSTDINLNMSDFNITPPTAMLGMIKSGDAIIIKVTWQLSMRPAKMSSER